MPPLAFADATLVLPDRLVPGGTLVTAGGRITAVGSDRPPAGAEVIDLAGAYLLPGFVDLHVHGGDGADFMDLSAGAFRTVCRCHARHGTTTLTPTSTAAGHAECVRFLELCRELRHADTGGARVHGGHLYGPHFRPEAKGCHPAAGVRPIDPAETAEYLLYAGDGLATATVAAELPGAEAFVRACRAAGVGCNVGHSYATFEQAEAAVGWGVGHVDHLFCAMSDRARLRQQQAFPMRGGVLEATLFFDELTTEVICDGRHLAGDLLRLAWKAKGPDRLCIVSDAMRAVDCPDGEYWFGPVGAGERVRKLGDVGVTLDGTGLASGVTGMDHGVRTFHRLTGRPLWEAVRMATLTPTRVLGLDAEIGSLDTGKRADLVVLDAELGVQQVYVGGDRVA
jgi:N-acetylglucosamine-6-phosphate deacetylase